MDVQEKLEVLADAGRFDLACACGTRDPDTHRRRSADGGSWLYPVSLPSGGKGLMLKTLISSSCARECRYCPLRAGADHFRRCTLHSSEVAELFMEHIRKQWLLGLFLSSGVIRDADHTMTRLIAVAQRLRRRHGYKGYIHLKVIPGASDAALEEAAKYASALSVNMETPAPEHARLVSPEKDWERDILRPMRTIFSLAREKKRAGHSRLRQTTQFIVGAARETDREIVSRTYSLYRDLKLERVYYSAYQAGMGDPALPGEADGHAPADRLTREHRLYQTDFLIRRYGFSEADVLFEADGRLSLERDPKRVWADAHPEFFPVRTRSAEPWQLLRVPGLGPKTVKKIVETRKVHAPANARELGLGPKRAALAEKYLLFE